MSDGDLDIRPFIPSCKPDLAPLLGWLRPRITDLMIHEISIADYGTGAEIVNVQLRRPLEMRGIPDDDAFRCFEVHECCSLMSNAGNNHMRTLDDHIVRLYASFVVGCLEGHRLVDQPVQLWLVSHLGRFTESAIALGHECCEAALPYVAWLTERESDRGCMSFYAIAMILLRVETAALTGSPRYAGQGGRPKGGRSAVQRLHTPLNDDCAALIDRVWREMAYLELRDGFTAREDDWLFCLYQTFRGVDESKPWKSLCQQLIADGRARTLPALQECCERILRAT